MQDFKNLKVWQKAHELALLTYRLTADFPRDEVFPLRNSLRRTSVDIPAYIAEGCAKPNNAEFDRVISAGDCGGKPFGVLRSDSFRSEMLNENDHLHLTADIVEVRKMLSGFSKKLAV